MKRWLFVLATVLTLGGAPPATTAPVTITIGPAKTGSTTTAPATTAPTLTAPATTDGAPFGCDARAPNVCYFRIFYTRGDRIVILPAGMKNKVPGVTIGHDHYCMTLGKSPVYKCARKIAQYNS